MRVCMFFIYKYIVYIYIYMYVCIGVAMLFSILEHRQGFTQKAY